MKKTAMPPVNKNENFSAPATLSVGDEVYSGKGGLTRAAWGGIIGYIILSFDELGVSSAVEAQSIFDGVKSAKFCGWFIESEGADSLPIEKKVRLTPIDMLEGKKLREIRLEVIPSDDLPTT